MRLNKPIGMALFAGLFALPALPALAQTEGIALTSMTVSRLDVVRNIETTMASACCAQHVYESGSDTDFIYIDADFSVAWTEELDRIQISSQHIALEIASETEPRRAWARIDYFPQVERGGTSLNARRPRDFPEENAGAYMNMLFAVPTNATQATLVIGDPDDGNVMRLPVDLTGPVTELPAAASLYDVKITAITNTPELVTEDRMSRNTISGRLVPRFGAITRVEVEITPTAGNDTDNEANDPTVFLRSAAFALVGPEGMALTNLGATFSGSIRGTMTTTINWEGDEEPPTRTMTLFFHGSGAVGDYQLYFHDQEVADVTLR